MRYLKVFLIALIFASMQIGCFDDKDDVPQTTSILGINDFIWKGMNVFYLYKEDVQDLANNRFTTDTDYQIFLERFSSPEEIFNALKSNIDEFSFLVDDYVALEQRFDGISKNNGMEYGLVRYPNNPSNIFGFVRYVLPGTDAESKGIKRGDIFNTIDGTQITDKNFRQLLSSDTFSIGLANFDGTTITATDQSISLTKTQYTENPVFITKTIDVDGNLVGYLLYNGFTADFDTQLNAAFAQLKSQNITDLVLDLRYNGGGSVETAIDLASMITGQFNGKVFTTQEWNSELQEQFGETNFFNTEIRTGEAINSLNLSRVYILTTKSSASASELVINGLNPYIQTIKIGDTTRGKFQASITLYDSENYRRLNADPGHTYAMQPLVLRSINAEGFTDYFDGFAPDIPLKEDFSNLGILGNPSEPLLNAAINHISGNRSAIISKQKQFKSIGDSKMFFPDYQRMYIDY